MSGDTALRFIRYRNTKTGQVTKHHAADGEAFGVFVFAGYEPATELVQGLAELDEQGYILTDRSQKATADGLYAPGTYVSSPAAGGHRCGRRRPGRHGSWSGCAPPCRPRPASILSHRPAGLQCRKP